MPTLQAITDELLIEAINESDRRLVLIAPGVWPPIAEAVKNAWVRLGAHKVTVILDVNPETCRLGYGSLEGIQILQKAAAEAGSTLRDEPGVRICVLIADEKTFVFSPTPRLIEAPSGSESVSTKPQTGANGIVLSEPPSMLESDLGVGGSESIPTIGNQSVPTEKFKRLAADLETNPPKSFDLARAVNVYNAKIQFVEFKVEGCRLSQQRARLPQHLLHVVKGNAELAQKIQNSIQLLDSEDALVTDSKLSQDTIFKQRDAINKEYLKCIDRIGNVIERTRKPEFEKDVETLRTSVNKFSEEVAKVIVDRFNETAEQLARELLNDVLADMPSKWKKQFGSAPKPERVKWKIIDDLLKAFGNATTKIGRMKVETIFKDVTYEMLSDDNFRASINELFPDLPLMEEYAAAKERSQTPANSRPNN